MVAGMVLIGMQRCWFVSSVFLVVSGIVVDAEVTSLGGIVMDARLLQWQRGESAGDEGVRAGGHSGRQQ